MTDEEPNYQSYLKLPEMLALQAPLSEPAHPEELHFIVVHQAMELWFKLVLHDLERLVAVIDEGDFVHAVVVLRRVNNIMDICIAQTRSLEDMPPWSFHEFRRYLGTASGVQSQQFREIELLSGLRDPTFLAAIERALKASPSPAVARRREQRSVAEAHRDAAHAIGIADFAELYAEPSAHPDFWLLSETLVDYDAQWMRWRYEHILLVERAVGPRARGTGGTPAISFLSSRGGLRFFPYLWAARNDLSVRSGGELVP